MATEGIIEFRDCNLQPIHLTFTNNKCLVSETFLVSKLTHPLSLVSLNAVFLDDTETEIHLPVPQHKNMDGSIHYILDNGVSTTYVAKIEKSDEHTNMVSPPLNHIQENVLGDKKFSLSSMTKSRPIVDELSSKHSIGLINSSSESTSDDSWVYTKTTRGYASTSALKESACKVQGVEILLQDAMYKQDTSSTLKAPSLDNVYESNDVIRVEDSSGEDEPLRQFAGTDRTTEMCKSCIVEELRSRYATTTIGKIASRTKNVIQVMELPRCYDGDCLFELPPTSSDNRMEGMELKYDGHLWTKPITSNVLFDGVVRISHCAGKFECSNESCPHLQNTASRNQLLFKGLIEHKSGVGMLDMRRKGVLKCHFCGAVAMQIGCCPCTAHYIMPCDRSKPRLMIHQGNHNHEVQVGVSRENIRRVKSIVHHVVKEHHNIGARKAQMEVTRKLIEQTIMCSNRAINEYFGNSELDSMFDEMQPLVQSTRFRYMIMKAKKASLLGDGGLDSILELKRRSLYDFFHGSRFPGQGGDGDRCFIFKMSTKGRASGVDLVNRMNRDGDGDLNTSWIMFDHTKRVIGWTTFACHVYDPSMRELLTIATCEMKEEDTNAQIMFWEHLNHVMQHTGHNKANFYGFMADEAQAGWRAVRHVFNGGVNNIIEGRERSCLFHWEQSLQQHNVKYVAKDRQYVHKQLCEQWRLATTKEEAEKKLVEIQELWRQGAVSKTDMRYMQSWLCWWGLRSEHWANYKGAVIEDHNASPVPTVNMAESKHHSWLAGEGFKKKITLYDAAVTDIYNALIQSAKARAYHLGKHLGRGPTLKVLEDRARKNKTFSPTEVVNLVNETVSGTPLYTRRSQLEGDNETTTKRRRPCKSSNIQCEASHRPELDCIIQPRKGRGRPRKILADLDASHEVEEPVTSHCKMLPQQDGKPVFERDVHDTFWAIRRTKMGSRVKCFGWTSNKTKCNEGISSSGKPTVAPCFFARRSHPYGRPIMQMVWFCNFTCTHTWSVDASISPVPSSVPNIWPVQKGTNLSQPEVDILTKGGFLLETENGTMLHGGRSIHQSCEGALPSDAAMQRMDRAKHMNAEIVEKKSKITGKDETFLLQSHNDIQGTKNIYEVTVCNNPSCTCVDFQERLQVDV